MAKSTHQKRAPKPNILVIWGEEMICTCDGWPIKLWTFPPAQQIVGRFLATFKDFPPSQKSYIMTVDQVLAKLSDQQSRK